MPAFISAFLGGLITISGTLAGRVMLALGFSAVTYTGISGSLTWLKAQALSHFTGLGVEVLGMLSVLKVGECISIVTSAILARMLLNGLAGDAVKRLVMR